MTDRRVFRSKIEVLTKRYKIPLFALAACFLAFISGAVIMAGAMNSHADKLQEEFNSVIYAQQEFYNSQLEIQRGYYSEQLSSMLARTEALLEALRGRERCTPSDSEPSVSL